MWYVASLMLEAVHDEAVTPDETWEEVVVLVNASDLEEAKRTAKEIGRSHEHGYRVGFPTPHKLRWCFRGIERVCEIEGALAHGVELLTRYIHPNDGRRLVQNLE